MSSTILVDGDLVTLTNTFSVSGTATDPDTITLAVTDPAGTTTTYTYAGGTITRTGTGVYSKDVTASTAGVWHYKWTGTGAAADVATGSFTITAAPRDTLYVPLEDFKNYLAIDDTGDDAELLGALTAACRAIDDHCQRRFYRDGSATARTYRASNPTRLWVDDIATTTGLVVATDNTDDGTAETTWTITTDFVVEPTNALAQSRPATKLVAVGSRRFPTSGRRSRVSVTADWGWPAIPAEVRQAALILGTRLFKRKDAVEGVFGFAEFGVARLSRTDPDVAALLESFRTPVVA